jgi:hypothetical protein
MTPIEKAKELVKKFKFVDECFDCGGGNHPERCAIIAVDEILDNMKVVREQYNYVFWQQVKEEIEKM